MAAHSDDLRAQVQDEALVENLQHDFRRASLSPVDRALCVYAEKLTRTPWEMKESDVLALREAGLSDGAILEAVQVIAYFNYINRVAEGLGVEPE